MSDEPTIDGERSINTVIRGFTDAELALREVSGAVERIRSASEQLDGSRTDQVAAREALTATVDALSKLGERMEAVTIALAQTHQVLSALNPDRLWQQLESHSAALDESTHRIEMRMDAHDRVSQRISALAVAGVVIGLVILATVVAYVLGVIPAA